MAEFNRAEVLRRSWRISDKLPGLPSDPLVKVYKTMGNHHCSQVNQFFLWQCSIANSSFTRGCLYNMAFLHGYPETTKLYGLAGPEVSSDAQYI
jgi:hypothetical protein